jgi:hypothetical protein
MCYTAENAHSAKTEEVRIDMDKPRPSHHVKLPFWTLLGACVFLASVGAFCADRALREPRIAPNDAVTARTEAARPDLEILGSLGVNVSEVIVPESLTGADAPDFTLPDVQSGETVHLKDILLKSVVLVFGSYDCPVFCDEAEKVEHLYQAYKDKMRFLFVQVAAGGHLVRPLDAIPGLSKLAAGERMDRARAVVRALSVTMPSVLDMENQSVQKAYDANPKRMVLVEPDGKIAADSGRGVPNGWDLAGFEAVMKARLSESQPAQ